MTLADHLRSSGITLFACLPAAVLPVRMPRLLERVSGARSVLFAAIPYFVQDSGSPNLAMFARSRDYHAFAGALADSCRALLLSRFPDAAAAGFADHSPFDESRGAAMAGIGILGDHDLLITEPYSSYVFIFELVTSLTVGELASEGIPAGDGVLRTCGHCGACARACPGGCIGGGRAACLSAISQKKNPLTEGEAALLRTAPFAWGCDICQDSCPHTARARAAGTLETTIPYFRQDRLPRLSPEIVQNMSDEDYADRAFGWRKKEIMLRNLRLREE